MFSIYFLNAHKVVEQEREKTKVLLKGSVVSRCLHVYITRIYKYMYTFWIEFLFVLGTVRS